MILQNFFLQSLLNSNLEYCFKSDKLITLNASTNFDAVITTGFYMVNLWVIPSGTGKSLPNVSNEDKQGVLLVFENISSQNAVHLYLSFDGTIRYRALFEGSWSAWTTK